MKSKTLYIRPINTAFKFKGLKNNWFIISDILHILPNRETYYFVPISSYPTPTGFAVYFV